MLKRVGIALAAALFAFLAAHLWIVASLARQQSWGRAVTALVVPPLAPWWAWEAKMRLRTAIWSAALALYAFGVAAA